MEKKAESLELEIEIEITTELRLGLPGGGCVEKKEKKRVFAEIVAGDGDSSTEAGDRKMETKSQVVGWPPVCLYRKKISFCEKETSSKIYVKVSMDGAPFLRKIDLGMHKEYLDLALALEKLFGCFGIGKALKDGDSSEYVPIYEDKDGDWMLVGDVPWQMFMESCNRLRIMKKADAKGFGIQPRGCLKGVSNEE